MTLIPVETKSIPMLYTKRSRCKAMKVVEEFMRSEHEAVQLQYNDSEYTNVASALGTYRKAVARLHVDCVVLCRQGKVYLIKGGVFND